MLDKILETYIITVEDIRSNKYLKSFLLDPIAGWGGSRWLPCLTFNDMNIFACLYLYKMQSGKWFIKRPVIMYGGDTTCYDRLIEVPLDLVPKMIGEDD